MDFDDHFPIGAVGKRDRLDVRIDHGPLTGPVAAHFVASADMTAFHAICPNDILVHSCKYRFHITSVEAVVNTLKELHFVRHSNLPSSCGTLAQTHFPTPSSCRTSDPCHRPSWNRNVYLATEWIVGNPSLIRIMEGLPVTQQVPLPRF